MPIARTLLLLLLAAPAALAQQPAAVQALHPVTPMPAYEVATIKPAEHPQPLGMTASRYIKWAFSLPMINGVVLNGPDWIEKTQYTIQGKMSEADRAATEKMTFRDQQHITRRMGQSLLADRFHLQMHFETREMPIYQLVLAKGGPKMTKNDSGEADSGYFRMEASQRGIWLTATNESMGAFASALQGNAVDRPVLDKTGLPDRFDFKMQFASDGRQLNGVVAPSDADNGSPSIFTALNELGLRLEPTKAQVEVVVIDHIDPPTEN